MRRTPVTSALLVVALATSTSACVAGWTSQPGASCHRPSARQACSSKKPSSATAADLACSQVLKSLPGMCGIRGLVQFQFVTFHAFEISAPLQPAAGDFSAPSDAMVIVSSIGPPETDRGPPAS